MSRRHGPGDGSNSFLMATIFRWCCKVCTPAFACQVAVFLLVTYFVTDYVHTLTYIWQCTTLASTLGSIERNSCAGVQLSDQALYKDVKLGIVMVYDSNYGGSDKEMVPRILKNRHQYCSIYHCETISVDASKEAKESKRPPAWVKLPAMKRMLETNKYDYLLFMDMDMVIMNPQVSPAQLLSQAPKNTDFIMTKDWSGANTGIWFARNSDFTKWFLQQAWDQEQLVGKTSANGIPHPFEYEQRAFHYLLETDVWANRGLPRYKGNVTEVRKHFHFLPQCSMNSYMLHPLDSRGDREVSQYVPGDFIVHLAGKKGQIKADVTNYYLGLAEEGYDKSSKANLRTNM